MKGQYRIIIIVISFFIAWQLSAQTPGILYFTVPTQATTTGYGLVYNYDPLTKALNTSLIFNNNNGSYPQGSLMQDTNRMLYGMASFGGLNGNGVIFSINPITGKDTILYNFNSASGTTPKGNLIQASDGLLYGMASQGGKYGKGVLFSFDPIKDSETVLVNFNDTNGAVPIASLIQASNGLLYGMTSQGGIQYELGTLFSYNIITHKDTVLLYFNNTNGGNPRGSLIQGSDGLLYGMTYSGGTGGGVIFSYNTTTNTESVLYDLDLAHGNNPFGSLIQGKNGYLYGLTSNSPGSHGYGTLFRFNIMSQLDSAIIFFYDSDKYGYMPEGSLMQAVNGSFYGTTNKGGTGGSGLVFRYDTLSNLDSVIVNFNGTNGVGPNGDVFEAMTATLNKVDGNVCFGDSMGSAVIKVRGGHYPLIYSWSNGATTDSVSGLKAGAYTAKVIDQKGIAYNFNFTIGQPAQIRDSIVQVVNVSCYGDNNGSAIIGVKGGIKPYNYLWSPAGGTNVSANNLTAGSYSCIVTDSNNCHVPVSVIITQPALLKDSTITSTNVTCYGSHMGAAKVGVTGGTGPYNYLWSSSAGTNSSAMGLAAGVYICTVTDTKVCNAYDTVVITQPAKISDSTSYTSTPCAKNNGSVSILGVSGGYPPYKYLWSNGDTNATDTALFAGLYTCTITDSSSCSVKASVFLPNVGGPKDSIISVTGLICFGDSNGAATVSSTGGKPPFLYQWSPSGGNNLSATGLKAGTYTFTTTDSSGCTGSVTINIIQPSAIRDSIVTITDVSCFGGSNGSIKIGVIGGTPPYTYNWSSGHAVGASDSLLIKGRYSFMITDGNGCKDKADTFSISSPNPLRVDTLANIETCGKSNGSAEVIVTGGTPPYRYLWNNSSTSDSIFNLAQGSYLCEISDAKNCEIKASVVVPDTGGPSAKIVLQVNEECFGDKNGSAIVSANGIPPYRYSWSSGPADTNYLVTNLPAGVFTCTVIDSTGCSGWVKVHITQPKVIAPDIQTIGVCSNALTGGSASVTVTGGIPPYSLSWSNASTNDSISNLAPGSYFCKVTDSSGCFVYSTFNIVQALNMTINNIVTQPTSCNGCANGLAYVNVSGGIPQGDSVYYYYIWSNGMTGDSIINNLDSGLYSVCVTSPYGCGSICDSAIVVAGISSVTNPSYSLKIYPNPSNGKLFIELPVSLPSILFITNELGQQVYSKSIKPETGSNIVSLNLGDLPDGLYFARISSGKGIYIGKIVIQR